MRNKIFISLFVFFAFSSFRAYAVTPESTTDGICHESIPYKVFHSVATSDSSSMNVTEGAVIPNPKFKEYSYNGYNWNIHYTYGSDWINCHFDWKGDKFCSYEIIQDNYTCNSSGICEVDQYYKNGSCHCNDPDADLINDVCVVLPPCPSNAVRVTPESDCTCISPYVQGFDLVNGMECTAPSCPPTYSSTPPLPLFLQTDDVSKCNFFEGSDGAWLDENGVVCCYGLDGSNDDPSPCPINEIEINGDCFPIENTDPEDSSHEECAAGSYWSINSESCVEWFPDANGTNPDGSSASDNASAGDTDGDGETDGIGSDGSYTGDDDFGIDMDGVQNSITSVLGSYVLLDLPVTATGSCTTELKKTFTLPIVNKSYTIDINPHISSMESYFPIIKGIILFMFSLSGVLIVLSGNKE